MKTKKSTLRTILPIVILLGMGVWLLFMGYREWSSRKNFINSSYQSMGVVIDLHGIKTTSYARGDKRTSTTYAPVIEYVQSEIKKTFTWQISGNTSPHAIGEHVGILVPKDGTLPKINSFMELWFSTIILGIFWSILTLIWFLRIIFWIQNEKNKNLLNIEWLTIQANSVTSEESTYQPATVHHGEIPLSYRIRAEWLNNRDGKIYIFYSEDINYNPKDYIRETISVTLLPDNPTVYTMDISDLPEKVDESIL